MESHHYWVQKNGKKLLGTFPGSLGNFAGQQRDLPFVTVEFSSASSMPEREDIESMWANLQDRLLERFPEPKKASLLSRRHYSHFFEVESKF